MGAHASLEALLGTREAQALKRRERAVERRPIGEVIAAVAARLDGAGDEPADEPLFLLSAGWRSGSTLAQRLVNSGGDWFLWGEPYSRADLVPRLADSLRAITDVWPRQADLLHEAGDGVEDRWTANLHPGLETLLDSHRALFRTLCAPPAGAADSDWGFKEVRLSADHALYLHLLFPRAKFVFLVRDPCDAYASYKPWRSWYTRWPEGQVRTAWGYAGLWAELAGGFLEHAASVGGTVIRYEDLVPGGTGIAALEALLGVTVDERVLANRISGSERGPSLLSDLERRIVRRRTRPVARRLGYPVRRRPSGP